MSTCLGFKHFLHFNAHICIIAQCTLLDKKMQVSMQQPELLLSASFYFQMSFDQRPVFGELEKQLKGFMRDKYTDILIAWYFSLSRSTIYTNSKFGLNRKTLNTKTMVI